MSITDGRRATDKHRAEIDEMIASENDPRERLKLIMLAKMVDMLVSHADDLDDRAGVLEILGDLDLHTRSSKIELTFRHHAGLLRGVRRVTPVPHREPLANVISPRAVA